MRSAAKPRRRGASAPVRRVGVQVSDMQRSRMLNSAVQVLSEYGYGKMSVARVTGRARVSRRTFYDFFEDREDCFVAVFDDAVARVGGLVAEAYAAAEGGWPEHVRAGLITLLARFDEDPEVASLLVVDTLRAGPRVLRRRAQVLGQIGAALDEGGARAKSSTGAAELTGEGVVGAIFSVLHTRLSAERPGRPGRLVELVNQLMGMVVLPYLGPVAAQRELERRLPNARGARTRRAGKGSAPVPRSASSRDPLAELPMRLTYRTLRALAAVAERPGASNREIADLAEVADQGQMSKLLARLERLGLIHNAAGRSGQPTGEPNAWRLTPRGEEVRVVFDGAPPAGDPRQRNGAREVSQG
jgi:AcrR family transcriptional regulator